MHSRSALFLIVLIINLVIRNDCRDVPMSTEPPLDQNSNRMANIPQFVMISFDDSITTTNFQLYKQFYGIKHDRDECPIGATFYVSHEYAAYNLVHELHRMGHEIAVHTITHQTNTDYWKNADKNLLIEEIIGMRKMIAKYADININDINGFRAPFLQTSGNKTFQVLKENGFKYDSSMPTLTHSKPIPIFPYTLDNGYQQDCVVSPCPTINDKFPDLYVVPMVDYWRKRLILENPPTYADSPCSMADMCIPYPETGDQTFDYFKENFDRHYLTNKAPFPMFLHYAWLSDPNREQGFLEFIEYLTTLNDVYLVTVQEVLDWMEYPVPLKQFERKRCVRELPETKCSQTFASCEYSNVGEYQQYKSMGICGQTCPKHYPWLNNIYGENEN